MRARSLVYLFLDDDLDAIAREFDTHVHDNDWGRDLGSRTGRQPDRVGEGPSAGPVDERVSVDAVARDLADRGNHATWSP